MAMSTRRIGMSAWQQDKTEGVQRGANGFRLCRWCRTECKSKRQTLCSEACRVEWDVRRSPSVARHYVYQRDRGVCALCRMDTDRVRRRIMEQRDWRQLMAAVGYRSTLWDADHIVPVVDGGGETGLENLRTLCLWCHKSETAALAKRRAEARKPVRAELSRQLPLIEVSA